MRLAFAMKIKGTQGFTQVGGGSDDIGTYIVIAMSPKP